MMGIRLAEGLDGEMILNMADRLSAADALRAAHKKQVNLGFLHDDMRRWRLTDRGFLHADGVAGALMASVKTM